MLTSLAFLGGGVKLPSIVTFLGADTVLTWTDMPAALTELFGSTAYRTKADLSNVSQARIVARVESAGAGSAELRVQYSTDQSSWDYLDGASGPGADISGAGTPVSSWVDLAAGAKADVFLRIVGINGDGSEDPEFGVVMVEFK